MLAQHLIAISERPGEAAQSAGRSWAALTENRLQGGDPGATPPSPASDDVAITAVLRMLGDSGFAPELSPDGTVINLHRCPFRELAVSHPDVVCGAHLGIIQGALEDLAGMVSATRLLPFVTPGPCVTTLDRSTGARGRESADARGQE